MGSLLYVKASPMGDLSFSIAVADAFVDAYSQAHPDDEITVLDLFYDDLPAFDFQAASAKYKIMHGKRHTQAEKETWARIISIIEQFKAADKYVFAVPMWNFSIPYRLKQYIDIIVQPEQTFRVTAGGGYEGLVKDKPVVVVYARGGDYGPASGAQAYDLQTKYFQQILGFIGLTDVRSIIVEPTLAEGPQVAEARKARAVEEAKKMARTF